MNYSEEFTLACHQLLTGKPEQEITPPNGNSLEWERELFAEMAKADPKKRLPIYHQKTVKLEFKAQLDEAVFSAREKTALVEYIGKKQEAVFKAANYIDVLGRLGYKFRLCDLDDSVEVNKQPITDAVEAEIRARCRDVGLNKLEYMRDSYIMEAARNHYNPIVDYLTSLKWDGVDWITTLGAHFSDEYDLMPVLLRRWLIGAVARIFEETQNRMLVLDGKQGIGKSRFVAWLASPLRRHFYEGEIKTDDKDFKIRLSNTWIWEVSELGSTIKRSDIEALKAFLTMQRVKVRAPFQRNPIDKLAITSFVGTVNNIGGVLNDASGNRRFMSTTLLSIDFDYEKIDVNQVWAQAYALYRAGERWNPEGDELSAINEINEKFETENPVIDLIVKKFDIDADNENWFTPTLRLLELLQEQGWGGHNPTGSAMVISTACKKMGIKKAYKKEGSRLTRGYYGLRERFGGENR